MSSRDQILRKLRAARQPFKDVSPPQERRHMVVMKDTTLPAMRARFILEAEKLHCSVYAVQDDESAIERILELIGADKKVLRWDTNHIPVRGLAEALDKSGIVAAELRDDAIRVGLTGVDVALAATGSLVVMSGPGKPRQASLLPPVYVAVVRDNQLMADIETWMATQKKRGLEYFRKSSKVEILSGPSKTADIAQELVLGAHGPVEVHVVLIND